jgi:histone-lysine N-methyltransferase SETMAR
MKEVRDFIAALDRGGKSRKEIKPLVDAAYGDKTLSISQINRIIKAVKEGKTTSDLRHSNAQKTKWTDDVVAAVAATIETDRRLTIREIAGMLGLTFATVQSTLTVDLGLVKKSARWVPKLLSSDQKEERVRRSEDFLQLLWRRSLAVLDNIVTMDESAVSFQTPETKRQSRQWVKKGQPGPIKARVHASRTKQMVLVFFDAKGVIYTNYAPKGETINASYIRSAASRFLKVFKEKQPIMSSQDWWLHWDNAPVHTATSVVDFLVLKGVKTIPHPPYSPDLAPADFFLFPKVKAELAGQTLRQLGGGCQDHPQGRLRCRLQAVDGAVQKVRPDRRQLCRKIVRNKRFFNLDRF